MPRVFHSPDQGYDDRHPDLVRPVAEHVKDVGRQLEDRHVVDVVADGAPGTTESGKAMPQRFAYGRNVLISGGETVLESESDLKSTKHPMRRASRRGSFRDRCWR